MKKLYAFWISLLVAIGFVHGQTVIPVENELLLPQYAYYGGSSTEITNRMPVAVRLKLTGLNPSTTYRYMAGMSNNASLAAQAPGPMYRINNSATTYGNITGYSAIKAINSSEINNDTMILSGASRHAKFATNASGEYIGWFACATIGAAAASSQQALGADVYFYINLGSEATPAAGITQSFRTTSTIRLLDYSTTPGDAAGLTGLIGTSDVGDEKMVAIFDNTAGTGRPLYCTFTENNNSRSSTTPATTMNESNVWTGLYSTVDAVSGSWAAVIPNSLSGGVKAINFYNMDGSLATLSNAPAANTSNDGVWNGVSTANPAGGATSPIVISSIQNSSLPVQLLSFQGKAVKAGVELTWTTAQEINNKHFELRRAGVDGRFVHIGTVAATTAAAASHQYSLVDAQPLSGKNFYQLKQVDKDGKATIHKTIMVNAAQQKQSMRIVAQSNEEIVIGITTAENGTGTITYTDMHGRVLFSRQAAMQAGDNIIRIPAKGMAKQMGIISFITPNAERVTLKVIQ